MQNYKENNTTGDRKLSDKLFAKNNIVPPSNTESEQDFLKGIIEHNDIIESLKLFKNVKDIFYHEIGGIVYEAIIDLYDKNTLTINVLIIYLQRNGLLKKAKETYPMLLVDSDYISLEVVKFSFKYLIDLMNQRNALNAILLSINDLDKGDVDSVVGRVEKVVQEIKDTNSDVIDYGITNHMNKAIESINKMIQNPDGLYPTSGLHGLSRLVPYFYNDDVIIFAGRPGMGKTICGVKHTIEAAVQGFPVGYVSLEMSAESLIKRMISTYSRIPYSSIKKGDIKEHEIERFNQSVNAINALPIFFYDRPERDISDITKWFRIMAKEKGVKLFVIDYVQLIEDKSVEKKEYSQITSVSKELKKINRELNVPIIELVQLNREVEATTLKRPSLKDLRGSGQLEQDASIIIMLHRQDHYGIEDAKQKNQFYEPENTIEYIIKKNRDNGIGDVTFHCEPAFNLIQDI